MPTHLARIGVTVFALLFAIAVVTEHQAAGESQLVITGDSQAPAAIAAVFERDGPRAVAGFQEAGAAADPVVEIETAALVAHVPPATVVAPLVAAPVVGAPSAVDGIVLASWYGPGFYGNRTACGQTYTPEILGVAHKTLPCGTLLSLTYGTRAVTVAVIDRGPYIAGRTLDLSNATKLALGCTDLCTLRMQIAR